MEMIWIESEPVRSGEDSVESFTGNGRLPVFVFYNRVFERKDRGWALIRIKHGLWT